MSLNQSLPAGGALLRRNFLAIYGVAFLSYVSVPVALFAYGRLIVLTHSTAEGPIDPIAYWRLLGIGGKMSWLLLFVVASWTPQLVTHAAAAWIADRESKGQTGNLSDAVKFAFGKLPSVILLSLGIGVPVLIGSLLFILPGLIVSAVALMIVPEAVMGSHGFLTGIRAGLQAGWRHASEIVVLLLLVCIFAFILTHHCDRLSPDSC